MLSHPLVRSVLAATPDAMIIIDSSGKILFGNTQVQPLLGYTMDEIVGLTVEALLPAPYRARHVMHRELYARTEQARPMGSGLELFALRKDGSELPVEISLSPIRQEGQNLIAAAIRDATERKHAERSLQEARNEADRANRAKSRFLATASHDLRQPLQSLTLLNGALLRMTSDADMIEALEQQDQAITSMSGLLNALLDISKLESGATRPRIVDVPIQSLLSELRLEFTSVASWKGLRLEIAACDASVHSDGALVSQILTNLVSNAIKYTQAGEVSVRCEAHGLLLRIEVTDSGVGIAAADLEHIFDEFYQVGIESSPKPDGYGLGLSIVQRLVQLLELGLEVTSEVGRGTTFALSLPLSVAPAAAVDSQTPQRGKPRASQGPLGAKILLVDDDPAVLKATKMLLTVEGYDVQAASTLRAAIAAAGRAPDIDLIVTDYHLADRETGPQVIREVRAVLGTAIPAILVTGDTSANIAGLPAEKRLRVASKPVRPDELLKLAEDLLTSGNYT